MPDRQTMFEPVSSTEAIERLPWDKDEQESWQPILPVPDDVSIEVPWNHHGTPSVTWEYRNADGNLLFLTARFDLPEDKKSYSPLTYWESAEGHREWRWKALPTPRPLYGLDHLAGRPDAPVLICEGEKATDTARDHFPEMAAITWPNGCGSVEKADWSPVKGRSVTIWPDNDQGGIDAASKVADACQKAGASEIRIVSLPGGLPDKWDLADTMPNDWNTETMRKLIDDAEPEKASDFRDQSNNYTEEVEPYKIVDGKICHEKATRDGPHMLPLCNFNAQIVEEEVRDDGAEQTTFFTIEGTLPDGRTLSRVAVPADRYASLNWVLSYWGTAPVVYAGQGNKDHLRVAIQLLSGEVPRTTVFAHIGWRKVGDDWVFLSGNGAIGTVGPRTDIQVQLGDTRLRFYSLPKQPNDDGLKAAIAASLSVLEAGPKHITYPLMAAVYRAPLGEAAPLDLTVFLAGPTGTQKTEITAIAQAHYGAEFHGKNLPGNWATTANGLEKQAFLVKDAIFTVDDFAPNGTTADVQRLHSDADRLFRGQGNRAGRGRMRPDGSMRPEYYPRGIVVSSGEDIPRGQSLRARSIIGELSPGDIDLELLTKLQQAAAEGQFAQAMAGYIWWLAPQIETLKTEIPERLLELRKQARKYSVAHDRTPDIVASLMTGWETFLRFALESDAISEAEHLSYTDQCWNALIEAAETQAGHQVSEEPGARFLTLLGSAISSGQAHLVDSVSNGTPEIPERWGWRKRTGGSFMTEDWQPTGDRIGWVDGEKVYLDPDATYAVVQRLARDQNNALAITPQTLWKRLAEKGFLASKDAKRGRNTVRKMLGGTRRAVIHVKVETLCPQSGPTGPIDPRPNNSNDLGVETVGQFSNMDEKLAQETGPQVPENSTVGPNGPVGPQMEEDLPPWPKSPTTLPWDEPSGEPLPWDRN